MGETGTETGAAMPDHNPPSNKLENTTDTKEDGNSFAVSNIDLITAAWNGSHTEVESLLEKGADVNTKDLLNGRTALHLAAQYNSLPLASVLLKHPSIDPEIPDTDDGDTPLGIAAYNGSEEIIQALLKHPGVKNPNKPDTSCKRTPLHLAVRMGHKAAVEALLTSKSVDLNATDKFGMTPVHIAAREGYTDILQSLLEKRAKIDMQDENGDSPLHLATRARCKVAVELLLRERVDVGIKNNADETPLHSAFDPTTGDGQDDQDIITIVTALLENGADISAREKESKETVLHMAARKGPPGAVDALLSFKKSVMVTDSVLSDPNSPEGVNSRNVLNYTPLSIAVRHRQTEIVRLMLEKANPRANLKLMGPMDDLTRPVTTTLENAVRKGNTEIVELFLEPSRSTHNEIDTPWNSDIQYTPLTWAVKEGNFELTKTLLERCAGIDMRDGYSRSPLHISSELGNIKITELLLDHNPKIDLKEQNGWTALHYASHSGHDRIIQLLLQRKADACARTRQDHVGGGNTPLSLALCNFHVKSINVLLGCLRSIPQDSNPGWEGRYLGLENDSDYKMRYSFDRIKRAADYRDTHDLIKFVLKQREFLNSRASDKGNGIDDIFLIERYPTDFDATISRIRRHVGRIEREKNSWTALEWAVYWGKLGLVERVVVSGSDSVEVREHAKSMAQSFCEEIRRYTKEMKFYDSSRRWFRSMLSSILENKIAEDDTAARELQDIINIQDVRSSEVREPATSVTPIVRTQSGLPITSSQEPYDKLREVEEDYIDIQDALRYGIPLDPGIVKIADVNKVLSAPSLDEDIRGLIGDFFAGIIDIYNDNDGVALLRRSRKVEDVIYDKGPRAIIELAKARIDKSQERSGMKLKEEDLQLRWVHLPANNMQWMEDLDLKLRLDKNRDYGAAAKRPKTDVISQDFLQRSWHQLPMGMKPTCVKLIIEPEKGSTGHGGESNLNLNEKDTSITRPILAQKLRDSIPDALALYMPYFTFGTLTNEECTRHQQTEEGPSTMREAPAPSYEQSGSYESPIIKIIRNLRHRIRVARIGRKELGGEEPHLPARKPTLSRIKQVETYDSLIDAYEDSGGILHPSQTLDEYFHHSISDKAAQEDLQSRNQTQVTSKRILEMGANEESPGAWTIIRVDHLWLWVIDDKTIISSSTHRKDGIQDPILEGIWQHMNSNEVQSGRASLPSSAYGMAQFITEFCINFFHSATCKVSEVKSTTGEVRQVKESIPEIYKNAINKTSRDEARLLADFTSNISVVISSLKSIVSQGALDLEVQARQQVKSNFASIQKASELLKQIKDIRDELNMLKSVLIQQKSVWNELHDLQSGEHNLRGPAYAINSIDEMDAQAARVQSAVLSILDLEQNKASIQEAVTSREQAQESIRQGRTLMAFTVVRIFFLPGSFLVALFALNIAVFPHSGDNVYWPDWVFGITFGLTIALLAIILTTAFYLDSARQFIKDLNDSTKPKTALTKTSAV